MRETRVAVTVAGLWRGVELAGEAQLDVGQDDLVLDTTSGVVVMPYAKLEGIHAHEHRLTLFLVTGDTIELSDFGSPALPAIARDIARRACALPELTRSLRALGSRRAVAPPEHDRFFEPLLEARRVAEGARALDDVLTAFDAGALRSNMTRRLAEFAAARYPDDAPERRALEAELLDGAEALFRAFDALGNSANAVRSTAEGERFAAWRQWTRVLTGVFEHADQCWLDLLVVLVDARRAPPNRKRRGRWGRKRDREDRRRA
ncbi:MAG TPA: hypothetical protein VFW98_12145 [Gemmatimonadaceae bacterium]|nr:hypothetical protein [Gemmatimonadaceae bacterium]